MAPAGAAGSTLTKEQQLSKLKLQGGQLLLEQRRESLKTYKEEWDAARQLFDQGFIALQRFKQIDNKYEQAKLAKEEAEILLEQTKLDLLENATHIVVVEASKYKTEDGKGMVNLTLENASDIHDALLVDESLTEEELRTLLKVENIFVSLENGPIVGEPYERRIPALAVGERETLPFRLLRDETFVVAVIKYLETTDRNPVILKKGGQQNLPSINSAQFSQEGVLDDEVSFGLTLELLADEEQSFVLGVLGLPQRIDYSFADQGAKVNQVKFDENKSQAKINLELKIPEKLDRRFVGRTRTFFALVTYPAEYARINALKVRHGDEPIPEKEVKALQCNYAKLELIPTGVGKLEVLVANRYQEVKVGEELQLRVDFLNRGTVAVQNIKAVLDLPYEWESEVEPALIKLLEPDERAPVQILARPPLDVAVGDYELGVEAQGQVGNENIESLEKNITIRIGARSNIAGNVVLIGILVLLVFGIGLASIKISRR